MNLKRPYSFWIQVAKSDRNSYDDNLIQLSTALVYLRYLLKRRRFLENLLVSQQTIITWRGKLNARLPKGHQTKVGGHR